MYSIFVTYPYVAHKESIIMIYSMVIMIFTCRVLSLGNAGGRQVEVSFVCIFTQMNDSTQTVGSKYTCYPARGYRGFGFVILTQCCEHDVIIHLVLLLRVFILFLTSAVRRNSPANFCNTETTSEHD